MKVKLVQTLIGLLWAAAASATAEVSEPLVPELPAIAAAAEAAVATQLDAPAEAQVTIQAQRLDGRVNIPRCRGPVSASLASDRAISRNNTVRISCDSPDLDYPWQMFLSVRAEILFPVVVATRPLGAGDVLSLENLEVRYVDKSVLRGQQFDDSAKLIGTRAKRRIAQDSPIFAANICFVCKGDLVAIYAKTANFEIKSQAKALADGSEGDRIRVRNSNSNKVLEATVIGVGEVEVKM